MSEQQLGRLQALLERVQKNATRPRAMAAPPPPVVEAAIESEPELEPEPEPELEPVVMAPEAVVEETTMVRAIEEPAPDLQVGIADMSVEEVELLEDEIVDITDAGEMEAEADAEEVEELPASSRRPIASSMTEALAEAVESAEMDDDREIPLKTPPPESGPQAAPPPQHALSAPAVPQIEEVHEVDFVSGTQPTAAQLGATVDLEEAEAAELELGEPVPESPPIHAVREEVAVVEPEPESEPPPPEPVQPQVFRPALVAKAPPSAFVSAATSFHPQSFVELIDASLSLGR